MNAACPGFQWGQCTQSQIVVYLAQLALATRRAHAQCGPHVGQDHASVTEWERQSVSSWIHNQSEN